MNNTLEIIVDRDIRTKNSTIGSMLIDGKFECFTLEDVDRRLTNTMKDDAIEKIKVFGKTAIPEGRYEVIINMSNRFKRQLPLLLNVKGYAGIRIHSGNTSENTDGCILVGQNRTVDFVGNSRAAFNVLFIKIQAALRTGKKVFITIKN